MAWSSLPSATRPSVMVPPVSMSTVYMSSPSGRRNGSSLALRPLVHHVPPRQKTARRNCPGRTAVGRATRFRLHPGPNPLARGDQSMAADVEESQRKISALVRVGRAMVSAADYELALGTLIETVSRLLDVETGGFLVYDPARDELVLQQPAFGINDPQLIAEYHVPLSAGGNAVRVFLSQRAYLCNDAEHDPRMIHRFVEMIGARNILSIPLIVEDRPIGVFHAINRRGGGFDQADLDLLTLVAPLMAASVQSAQMFRELREKSRQLERAVFLQAELSRTALDAPGMEPLAERLADLIARPVMVLDSALRPIASARWPEGHAPSQSWLRRTRLTERDPDDQPVVTPIAVGTHFGGYLAVLPAGASLDVL